MNKLASLACLVALLGLTACDTSDSLTGDDASAGTQIVVTEGLPAPPPSVPVAYSTAQGSILYGSNTSAISLKPSTCSEGASAQVTISYRVTGRQTNDASFKIYTDWTYDGTGWTGANEQPIYVSARGPGGSDTYTKTLTLQNASTTGSGTSTFYVLPRDVNDGGGAFPLSFAMSGRTTVDVAFEACPVTNTPPWVNVPEDMTVEAEGPDGAVVDFEDGVTVGDDQDAEGNLTLTCTPPSGSTFPLGETTVTCMVTDSGLLSASEEFKITVVDTTPPAFFVGADPLTDGHVFTRTATSGSGWDLDVDDLGITAVDLVDGDVDFTCDPVDGTTLGLGIGDYATGVTCTAEDSRENPGSVTFKVEVGLNVAAQGFLPPLRYGPYSSHKRGSTIPHKVLPPTDANGNAVTDLVLSDLRLVLQGLGGGVILDTEDAALDLSAGSTTWRFEDGHYIFNVKTGTSGAWTSSEDWTTTVSYRGIELASTDFKLKR